MDQTFHELVLVLDTELLSVPSWLWSLTFRSDAADPVLNRGQVSSGPGGEPRIAPPVRVAVEDALLPIGHGDHHRVAPYDSPKPNPDSVFTRRHGQPGRLATSHLLDEGTIEFDGERLESKPRPP